MQLDYFTAVMTMNLRRNVSVNGDLEVALSDSDMGPFLDGDPELVNARQAYISERLVRYGYVKIEYDPNRNHGAPVHVEMRMGRKSINPDILLRLIPVDDLALRHQSLDTIENTAARFRVQYPELYNPKQTDVTAH